MLFVLIHRIIFHDKNLMDEEILKTASNIKPCPCASQAMHESLKYFKKRSKNGTYICVW